MSEYLRKDPAPLERSSDRFQILALSGGGYRGLFTAEVLALLEGGVPMGQRFDLIAGTSIGGIIAAALALGVSAVPVRDAISEYGNAIFPRRRPIQRAWRAPYDGEDVGRALQKAVGKPNTRKKLNEIGKALLLPAVSATGVTPRLLASRGLAAGDASACSVMQAARATSAAPTYFVPLRIGTDTLVDGGLIANAPDLVAVTEAMRWKKVALDDIWVMSVGTASPDPADASRELGSIGILEWLVRHDLFELTLSAQERLAVSQCGTLLGKRYLRINAVPSKEQAPALKLDRADTKATDTLCFLAGQAVQAAKEASGAELKRFLDHRAA